MEIINLGNASHIWNIGLEVFSIYYDRRITRRYTCEAFSHEDIILAVKEFILESYLSKNVLRNIIWRSVYLFYKTVQGLYNLALFRQRIGLRIVVHKQTYQRLPQLADYIYHNFPFVSQVAFLQMETIGNAEENIKDLWIDPHDYNEELKQAVLLLANRGVCVKIYNAQLCVLPVEIREFAVCSISDWKDTYLPECQECDLRHQCGGFFASNMKYHSKYITTQKNEDAASSLC